MNEATADEVIARLTLSPHPEGGHYRETFRHRPANGGRGAITVIYYLLRAGERSAWHRIDATEVWHFHAGAPLELLIADASARTSLVSAPTSRPGWPRMVSCRPMPGRAREALAPGRWSAARWRRPSSSRASSWRPRNCHQN